MTFWIIKPNFELLRDMIETYIAFKDHRKNNLIYNIRKHFLPIFIEGFLPRFRRPS